MSRLVTMMPCLLPLVLLLLSHPGTGGSAEAAPSSTTLTNGPTPHTTSTGESTVSPKTSETSTPVASTAHTTASTATSSVGTSTPTTSTHTTGSPAPSTGSSTSPTGSAGAGSSSALPTDSPTPHSTSTGESTVSPMTSETNTPVASTAHTTASTATSSVGTSTLTTSTDTTGSPAPSTGSSTSPTGSAGAGSSSAPPTDSPTPHTTSTGESTVSPMTSKTNTPVASTAHTTASTATSSVGTSPLTTSTMKSTFALTSSAPLTTSLTCLNGGTWNGKACACPSGYTGDKCQSGIVVCQNGGSWDGIKCVCTSLYQGQKCEEMVSSIEIQPPETVSAEMKLSVTVTSEVYTEELQNRSSLKFQMFNKSFTDQMNLVYAGIREYKGINITELTHGSVVVKHDVFLKANFTPEYKEVLKNATKKIEQKINNITNEQVMKDEKCESMLCFKANTTKVQNISFTQYDPEEECREKVGKDFADYFFVVYKDRKPKCISRCEPGFSASMNCHFGKCMLERSGPRCYCLTTDTDWYRGETCEFSTKKSLVYGLVGAVGAVILIVLVIMLVFTFRSRREVKRQKSKVTQLYKWHGEDGEAAHGTFQNIGFDTCEEPESSINLDSIYSNFQPALDNIDSNTKIKIQRPQVMITPL